MVEEQSQMELHHPSGVFSKLLREQYSIKPKPRIAVLAKTGVHLLQQPSALTDAQEKCQKVIVMGNYREFCLLFLSCTRKYLCNFLQSNSLHLILSFTAAIISLDILLFIRSLTD